MRMLKMAIAAASVIGCAAAASGASAAPIGSGATALPGIGGAETVQYWGYGPGPGWGGPYGYRPPPPYYGRRFYGPGPRVVCRFRPSPWGPRRVCFERW